MADIKSFQCPNCGSPVTTTGKEKEVKCAYCGTTVIVPVELRDSTPTPAPVFNFGQTIETDDQVLKTIGEVGKVTAGVTVGVTAVSVILPLALTCIILGVVGYIMFTVFNGVRSTSLASTIPTEVLVSDTPLPTDTPTLVPTPINTPVPFNKILLKDNFTNPSSGWDKVHDTNYTLEYKNGKYHMLINSQDPGQIVYLTKKYTDTSIEVGIQQIGGADDGQYGIACRVTDTGNYYSFEISQNGTVGIYKYTSWNPQTIEEDSLDPNPIINGKVNQLEGICAGENLTLLVDGQVIMQDQDSEYTSGGVGLIALNGSGSTGIDVLFSNLLVKGP